MPLTAAERARRYREKINQDVEKRAEYLRKCRERAAKQKKIEDLSDREKRSKRRKWRENQSRSRRNKAEKVEQLRRLEEITPPPSPVPIYDVAGGYETNRRVGRKKVANRRSASYRKIKKLEEELEKVKKDERKYRKRYERVKKKLTKGEEKNRQKKDNLTPITKMKVETQGYNVPEGVKRQLVVHNALLNQIKNNYKNNPSELEKQVVSHTVEGSILKKYKCQTSVKKKIGCFAKHKYRAEVHKKRSSRKRRYILHHKIVAFFGRDDITTLTPGKKQTVTRKKIKKQKRLLKDNMRTLYKKFCNETPFQNISFATFCRHRPFWVVRPKLSDRDSCLCKKHSNMQFKLDTLVKEKLHEERNIENLCNLVTCDTKSKECMMHTCNKCTNKEPIESSKVEENKDKIVKYFLWKLEREEVTKREKKFIVTKTVKVEERKKLSDLCKNFNEEFRKTFCPHVFKRNHQTRERQRCIAELSYDEAAIHMDFSENYLCKMNAEIQAMHFGSSHDQASLHTVVTYTEEGTTDTVCSISPSKRHDPPAIWAHLMPILEELKEKKIDTIHFFSDGPSSQYRNKENFYFLTTIFTDMGFKCATWNFSEASHGKGAPDGVGAAIKRVADGIVSKGEDITNADILFEKLQGKTTVRLFFIPEEKIVTIEKKKSTQKSLIPIKGIMKIGQVILDSTSTLKSRPLSCFCKKLPTVCSCHDPVEIGIIKNPIADSRYQGDDEEPLQPLIEEPAHEIKIGNWIVVNFNDVLYPGIITDKNEDSSEFEVNVLYSVGNNKYVWPTKQDKIWYSLKDICCFAEPPKKLTKRVLTFADATWLKGDFED